MMASTLPIEGYDTTREDGVTRIRPVYAAPLPVEAVSVQGQGLLPQEPPALPVELPVERSGGILADADRALSGAVRAPFDALDERLFGKSGKKGTYREAIQKFFKTGPSDEVKTGVNRLLGTGGEERYKTWPEKLVVDAITAPGNVLKSETPVTTEELIKPALDVSNLAGTGGLAGAGGGAGVAFGSGPVKRALSLPERLAAPTAHSFDATPPKFYKTEAVQKTSADGSKVKVSRNLIDGNFVDASGNIYTEVGKRIQKLSGDELAAYKKRYSERMDDIRNGVHAQNTKFDDQIDDLAKQLHDKGYDIQVSRPDDTSSRYLTVTKDGVSKKIRIADHAQPQEFVTNPTTGKSELQTVGGWSREKRERYSAADHSIDPSTGLTQEKVVALFSDNQPSVGIGAGVALGSGPIKHFDFATPSGGVRTAKIGPTEITYGVAKNGNDVELTLIKTDKNARGQGHGREALQQFIDEADANGKRVLLNADPMDKATSKSGLVNFYKSMGFVRNKGKNKDFETRAEYMRNPILKSDNQPSGSGPLLKVARKLDDGKIQVGEKGQIHADLLNDAELYAGLNKVKGEMGFVDPDGKFLSRSAAIEYVNKNEPHLGKDANAKGRGLEAVNYNSNILRSDNQPSLGIGAVSKSEKPFYSALEKSLGSINQAKATGEQWLGMLSNKGGVKPDELQWSGIGDFLAGKGSVTKAELEGFLKDNQFVLGEKTSHTPNPRLKEIMDLDTQARKLEAAGDKEGAAKIREVIKAIPPTGDFNPRYKQYQLPGGTNYREVLMTLPNKQQRYYEYEWFDPATQKSKQFKTEAEAKADAPKGAIVNPKEIATTNEAYKSSHWDEPNILAHMRMNDRTIDGKKSLHLEEIQSDWHQAGRKQGYKETDAEAKARLDELTKTLQGMEANPDPKFKYIEWNPEYSKLVNEHSELHRKLNSGVPDAPFKKNWHELALKRAIREAAENGYDRLSWTPGEAQAARYDLSKHLNRLGVVPNPDRGVGAKTWWPTDKNNRNVGAIFTDKDGTITQAAREYGDVVGKNISDVIGKEIAEKGLATNKEINLTGLDLKIGGEGMKGFYDNIVPKTIEKLGKQFGVKVQTGKSGKDTIYYIDIPPAMRDKVLAEGFPLFSANVPVIDNDQTR